MRPRFNFGFSQSQFAGGNTAGELGGQMFRGDGRHTNLMAFYGDRLNALTLDGPLKASGKVALRRAVSDSDTLIGFFHSEHSLASGGKDAISTPPDFLGVRIGGPSREGFYFAPIYRLHGREERVSATGPYIFPDGNSYRWTLDYSPTAANGQGKITVTLDDGLASVDLPPGHKALGAHFNRFGLITTHTDGNGQTIYFDDLSYTWTQSEAR